MSQTSHGDLCHMLDGKQLTEFYVYTKSGETYIKNIKMIQK